MQENLEREVGKLIFLGIWKTKLENNGFITEAASKANATFWTLDFFPLI